MGLRNRVAHVDALQVAVLPIWRRFYRFFVADAVQAPARFVRYAMLLGVREVSLFLMDGK